MNYDEVYCWIAIISMIGLVQSSLENLLLTLQFPAINNYSLNKGILSSSIIKKFSFAYNSPGIWIFSIARLLVAVLLLIFAIQGVIYYVLPLCLLLIDVLIFPRSRLLSSSEIAFQRVILITLLLHSYFDNPTISNLGLLFISTQLCLAYFSAGFHKLKDPSWRDGSSILKYAHENDISTKQKSQLWRMAGYLVILFEISFFLSLFGGSFAIIYFTIGILFHLFLSIKNGYNFFLWAFLSGYPAVEYISRNLSQIVESIS